MKITITERATGRSASYEEGGAIDGTVEFLWSDGNYGCDCNRSLFFNRALGLEDGDHQCSETDYAVKLDDGAKVIDL